MKKYNKIMLTILSVITIVITIFVTTQIPTTNPKVTDLPIAIVNKDSGNFGQEIVSRLEQNSSNDKVSIKWTKLDNKEDVEKEMDNENYYAALIIPENFSQNIASLASQNPQASEFELIINQGKNSQLSAQTTAMLTNIVSTVGKGISAQTLTKMSAQGNVSVKTSSVLVEPIKVNVTNVHSYGDLSAAGGAFFQPIWIASMITAMLMYISFNKLDFSTTKDKLRSKGIQLVIVTVVSSVIGYLTPLMLKLILNVEIPNITNLSIFLSIASLSFIILILGVVSWIGYAGVGLFALMLFFGAPLLQLAPEMITSFYSTWIMPILPMKGLYEGARSILFYNVGYFNSSTTNLVIFLSVGLILLLTSVTKREKIK